MGSYESHREPECGDDALYDGSIDDGDGWCMDCGDPFHLDDTGGYNPPCECGFHCRSCHEREIRELDDDYERPEGSYPPEDLA